jgi:flagellar motor switch protein FliN/FliY
VTPTLDTTTLNRDVGAAAQLLVGRLPVAFDPSPVDDQPGAVVAPGEGSMALTAGVSGLEGVTVVLALPAAVVAAVVDGPLGHQDLAEALIPVLEDAISALEPAFGSNLALDAPQVLAADLALESLLRSGSQTVTVTLQTSSGPGGVFVVAIPTPELELEPLLGEDPNRANGGRGLGHDVDSASLDMLGDVEMAVTAVLGRTRLSVRHLLGLAVGHVVELDRTADSAVDLLVNGTLVARGEVVVIDDEFGVRITEIAGRRARS